MRRSLLTAAAIATCLDLTIAARATQDPLVVSPDAYRLEFENAWVKVVRVVYGPRAIIAPHLHTAWASAYVYLNDGGPILFKHEGLPYAGVTRPATKAGSFRVYKGIEEIHSVENPTATPSEFLRVEFKTEPLDDASLKGKFFRDDTDREGTAERLQFENAQVRIARIRVAPGEAVDLTTAGGQPALLLALVPSGVVQAGAIRRLEPGGSAWLEGGAEGRLRPLGHAAEVLRFDFKTRPAEGR